MEFSSRSFLVVACRAPTRLALDRLGYAKLPPSPSPLPLLLLLLPSIFLAVDMFLLLLLLALPCCFRNTGLFLLSVCFMERELLR